MEPSKISKELLKISVSGNAKVKNEALTQLIVVWKASETLNNSLQTLTIKVLHKLSGDPTSTSEERMKEIIEIGVRKFGVEFAQKISDNDRLSIFIE